MLQKLLFNFYKSNFDFPTLAQIGFDESDIKVVPYNLNADFQLPRN